MDHITAFRDAIAAAGLSLPKQIIDDGKRHRFSSNGTPRDDSGWYILHGDDRPAGAFGCWRQQISVSWKHDGQKREFSAAEREAWRQRMQAIEGEREAERQRALTRAADKAQEMFAAAVEADERGHGYLTRKGIPGLGAKVLRDQLLIPMRHGPKDLVGLQVIQPDGSRKFLTGTPAAGAYTVIGRPSATGSIVICEGYATGVSIHLATQACVVVAFSAGNLKAVAEKIARAIPKGTIVVGADDDAFTDGNPGVTAAQSTGLPVVIPRWAGDRARQTDFNDLHLSEGLEAVRACFEQVSVPPRIDLSETTQPDSGGGAQASENPGSTVGPTVSSRASDSAQSPPAAAPARQSGGGVVDYFSFLPDTNDKGKPLSTIENVAEVCRRLGVVIRYNVISKEEEILIPNAGFSVDNRQNASIAWLLSECAKFRMPIDQVPTFITYLGDQNQYNPVVQWITSKRWDGQDHLTDLLDTVGAKNEMTDERVCQMKRAFITRWMISAVAAAFRPNGVSAHGVLVFQGAQYVGKTKWFKQLVPAGLDVLKDGMLLRPDDRDSVMKCVSNWLVELGEIDATFRKSDVAALKSFLTSDRDILRRAYARKESTYARRTVFFASVNPKNYLHDETGNRRYWTIEVERLEHDHDINMQQVWAQVHALWEGGESWFLKPDEMDLLNVHNKDFEVIDPIEELITTRLPWTEGEYGWRWRSATDVLISLGQQRCTKAEATKAGIIIRKLNGDRSKRSGNSRLLFVPDT